MDTRICSCCKTTKTVNFFYAKKDRKSGYSSHCRECDLEKKKINRLNNINTYRERERNLKRKLLSTDEGKLANKIKSKTYRQNPINKEKIKQTHLKWRLKNNTKQRIDFPNKDLFKLSKGIRNLIRISVKNAGFVKKTKSENILGCTIKEFKLFIETQFVDGMTWENHGKWHFDHKTPISWAKTEEEIIKLNHYTNFQPLWAEDNIKKSNKFSS